jgi:hypothetical protein
MVTWDNDGTGQRSAKAGRLPEVSTMNNAMLWRMTRDLSTSALPIRIAIEDDPENDFRYDPAFLSRNSTFNYSPFNIQ